MKKIIYTLFLTLILFLSCMSAESLRDVKIIESYKINSIENWILKFDSDINKSAIETSLGEVALKYRSDEELKLIDTIYLELKSVKFNVSKENQQNVINGYLGIQTGFSEMTINFYDFDKNLLGRISAKLSMWNPDDKFRNMAILLPDIIQLLIDTLSTS